MPGHFLNDLVATFVARGDAIAIEHRGRSISYSQLHGMATRCAALYRQHGLRPGDRVVLATGEKLPFLIAQLGTLLAGGVSLPLNPRFTRDELKYFLSDSGASVAVVGEEQKALVEGLRADLPALMTVLLDRDVADAAAVPADAGLGRLKAELQTEAELPTGIRPDDPCLILYSSGTTGWPKGVVHTHANVASSLRALADCWQMTADDAVVNVLPLFHIHGLAFATHMTLLVGGRLLLEDSFQPQQTLDAIARSTVFMAVPSIYYRLLDMPEFRAAAKTWQHVRLFTCGSAPIRPEVLPELEAILSRPIINRYGMTEAYVITSLPLEGPWPQGSVGRPLPGVELRIRRDDGQPAVAGEVGGVELRGPNLFRQYWNKPEATRSAFASGWFDTGDLGALDAQGLLTLVGRKHDLIITNGYNVYPQVVERAINSCPGVRESAVLGLPDARRGERVAAAIVRDDPTLDEDRLAALLGERLVDYQRPRDVLFLDELPRNALGKVLRRELKERMTSV